MIDHIEFLSFLTNKGFSFATGVPCSYFSRLIDALEDETTIKYITATREDEAVGIASGIAFNGKRAFVIMQNSGFATIGDALTSLAQLYKLPMLFMVSLRGLEPDRDFPEHSLMGEVTNETLNAYRVPFWDLESQNWKEILNQAISKMEETDRPVALLVKQGVL